MHNALQILTITNITMEPYYHDCLECAIKSISDTEKLEIQCLNLHEELKTVGSTNAEQTVIVFINFHELFPDFEIRCYKASESERKHLIQNAIDTFEEYAIQIKSAFSRQQVIWITSESLYNCVDVEMGRSSFTDLCIEKINIHLIERFKDRFDFLDIGKVFASVGVMDSYNIKNYYRWNSPYSRKFFEVLTKCIAKIYLSRHKVEKKLIVLDCDNVLWKGILEEDGIDGITIGDMGAGRVYYEFQRLLIQLFYRGMLLALCSKNDEGNVMAVLENHPDILLKKQYLCNYKINWNNKVDNIKQMASELRLSLESIIFVDDSEFEVAAVNKALPEVDTILFTEYSIFSEICKHIVLSEVSVQDVLKRNDTYQSDFKRLKMQENIVIKESYIEDLQLVIDIHPSVNNEIRRISDLSMRCNRCTNGKRYTEFEVKEKIMTDEDYEMFSVYLRDKFGDLGLIGVIGIQNKKAIDLFCMSCRAMGRNVEKSMIDYILTKYSLESCAFEDTTKNESLKLLITKHIPLGIKED